MNLNEKRYPTAAEMDAALYPEMIARESTEHAYEAAIAYAAKLGAEHGANAASWYFDGNTSTATYAAALRGIEDGDPAVQDTFPAPNLSGEWADSLSGPGLVTDALAEAGILSDNEDGRYEAGINDAFSDICDAYEAAFSTAVEDAIGATARRMLSDG